MAFTSNGAFAYVTISGFGGGVAVIDTASGRVVARIPTGDAGRITINHLLGRAYVTGVDRSSQVVWVIDTATHTVAGQVAIGAGALATGPDGARVYAADGASIITIDAASNAVLDRITGAFPEDIATSPDGCTAYVTATGVDAVVAVHTPTNSVGTSIPLDGPARLAVEPGGRRIYVTRPRHDSGTGDVAVVDTGTRRLVSAVPVAKPLAVAVGPDGTRAYVTSFPDPGALSVVDTTSAALITTLRLQGLPRDVAVSPDGTPVYVAGACEGVCVIDTSANAVGGRIPLRPPVGSMAVFPARIALSADGTRLFVLAAREFEVILVTIDAASRAVTGAVELRGLPGGIAVRSDGARAFVTSGSHLISVIDTTHQAVVETVEVGTQPVALAVASVPDDCPTPITSGCPQSCDDGDICNGVEQCHGNICSPGAPVTCGDSDPCTVDGCDPDRGCRHQPLAGPAGVACRLRPIAARLAEVEAELRAAPARTLGGRTTASRLRALIADAKESLDRILCPTRRTCRLLRCRCVPPARWGALLRRTCRKITTFVRVVSRGQLQGSIDDAIAEHLLLVVPRCRAAVLGSPAL